MPAAKAHNARNGDTSAKKRASKKKLVMKALLCIACTLVGAFYPTMVDWSKTATERWASLDDGKVVWQERRAYPFSPLTVVLIDDAVQLTIALFVVASKSTLSALWSDRALVLKMLPLGVIYALGEMLTLRSVQKSSGPVYVVVANTKLVASAVLTRAVFGKTASMSWSRWIQLWLISFAAAAYTICEAGQQGDAWRWEGAGAALLKSSLVAFSSVFCEHTYKNNPFHLTLTLQAFWGFAAALTVLLVATSGLAMPSIAQELTASAPEADLNFQVGSVGGSSANLPFGFSLRSKGGSISSRFLSESGSSNGDNDNYGDYYRERYSYYSSNAAPFAFWGAGPALPLCDAFEQQRCEEEVTRNPAAFAENSESTLCHCITRRGWDMYTIFTVLADLSNAVSSALVFRKLSAVSKYICRATSAVPMYLFYISVGRTSWSPRIFCIVVYLCFQVSMYVRQQHTDELKASKVAASTASDVENAWVEEYAALGTEPKRRTE